MCGGFFCAPAGRVGLAGLIDAARPALLEPGPASRRQHLGSGVLIHRQFLLRQHFDSAVEGKRLSAYSTISAPGGADLPVIPASLEPLSPPERDVGDCIPGVVDADE